MANVLLMEDERGIAMVLEIALGDEGHSVVSVANGLEGMKRLEKYQVPDIVLVDLSMPGMGGSEVVEKMSCSPQLKTIPVVILTGSNIGWVKLPPESSYKAIIEKPFDLDDVIDTINMLVGYKKKTA